MTRVLSIIHYPFFGGPQNQVLRLAEPLSRRGYATLVVLPDLPGDAFARLTGAGIDVVRMPLSRVRASLDWRVQRDSVATLAGDIPRLTRLIRRERIDLVLVHGLVNPHGAIAARIVGRPVVWQILDTRTPRAMRIALAPLVRALASSVMTTGHSVAEAHPWLPRDATRLFPFFPPVDTRLFAPSAERESLRAALGFGSDDIVVGCVANLTPQKGLETFLEVAEHLCRMHSNVRVALFGKPMATQHEYAQQLVERAAGLRDSGRLVIRDVGADVPSYVRTLDVFLATAPPLSEGISTTILEAMASAVPVVSTDVGAIREAVLNGTTGYIIAPDDRGALVRAVAELIQNGARRLEFAVAARQRAVEQFGVERCAHVHARAFEAALARARG